jgi:hypothetical protein
MGLDVTAVNRNLHTRVTFMSLEFEDLFIVLGLAALMNVVSRFVSGEIGGIPLSVVLQYGIPLSVVPLLMIFKYGKPTHAKKAQAEDLEKRAIALKDLGYESQAKLLFEAARHSEAKALILLRVAKLREAARSGAA